MDSIFLRTEKNLGHYEMHVIGVYQCTIWHETYYLEVILVEILLSNEFSCGA